MSHTNLNTYEKLSAENEMELRQILSRYISKSYASYRGTDHPTGEVIWWINQKLANARREVLEEGIKLIKAKYEAKKNEKPYIHKMLGQTAYGAKERRSGALSGLLVAKNVLAALKEETK